MTIDITQILCDTLMPLIEMVLGLLNPFLEMIGMDPIMLTCEDLFPPAAE